MKTLTIASILALAIPTCSLGQEEPYRADACSAGNKDLKEILAGKILQTNITLECGGRGGYAHLCSSMLKNSGKAPKQSNTEQFDTWSCLYSPANLSDGNPATAWVEGAPGDGIGEFVIVAVDVSKKIKIWAGYGKSDASFHQNSRPKKIRMYVIKVKKSYPQCGTQWTEISMASSSSPFTLKDINGYQDLPGIPFKIGKDDESQGYVYCLGIEILEAYPGTKYRDLCISEVSN